MTVLVTGCVLCTTDCQVVTRVFFIFLILARLLPSCKVYTPLQSMFPPHPHFPILENILPENIKVIIHRGLQHNSIQLPYILLINLHHINTTLILRYPLQHSNPQHLSKPRLHQLNQQTIISTILVRYHLQLNLIKYILQHLFAKLLQPPHQRQYRIITIVIKRPTIKLITTSSVNTRIRRLNIQQIPTPQLTTFQDTSFLLFTTIALLKHYLRRYSQERRTILTHRLRLSSLIPKSNDPFIHKLLRQLNRHIPFHLLLLRILNQSSQLTFGNLTSVICLILVQVNPKLVDPLTTFQLNLKQCHYHIIYPLHVRDLNRFTYYRLITVLQWHEIFQLKCFLRVLCILM